MLSLPVPVAQSLPKCYGPLPPPYDLQDLIRDIKSHLGETAGIDAASVDAEYLISLVQKYISNPDDWVQFFHNDPSKNYTRNAIENINSKANIVRFLLNLTIHIQSSLADLTYLNSSS